MNKKELEKRVEKIKAEAVNAVARRKKLNIRFSEQEIMRIFKAAKRNNKRPMPLLRDWVLEALQRDETGDSQIVELNARLEEMAKDLRHIKKRM